MYSIKSLRNNLNDIMKQKGIRVKDIQESTGLNRNTIYKILSGQSKNPTATNLRLISQALGISVNYLFDNNVEVENFHTLSNEEVNIYMEASIAILNLIQQKNKQLSLNQIASKTKEIYEYTLKNKLSTVDDKFINWIIDKDF